MIVNSGPLKVASALILFSASTIVAAPMTATPLIEGGDSATIQVRDGCGFGEHRGAYAGCLIGVQLG
jgi:hypothetical protein